MAKLVKPVLFSTQMAITASTFEAAGLVDPILNCDTKLFVDPILLGTSSNKLIKEDGYDLLKKRFSQIVSLVDASQKVGDAAWKAAEKLLSLDERPETCLGYGGSGTGGQRRPERIKRLVLATAKEIVQLGEKNPEIISLMGMFEEARTLSATSPQPSFYLR